MMKNKRLRYGTYSTVTAIVVIAVLIFVNLIVSSFGISYDLTDTGMYTISEKSEEIISQIDEEVTVYALYKTGYENDLVVEILKQYEEKNSNIKIVYKDPYLYPKFTESFMTNDTPIAEGSIIVQGSQRFKVIDVMDIFSYNYDTYYQTYDENDIQVESVDIEPLLTSAISYVCLDEIQKFYYVTGHNELELPALLKEQIVTANNDLEQINLFTNDVPEDCAMLLMMSPGTDYSKVEAEKIKNYLANDGRALIFADGISPETPNFESVINAYGVESGKNMVVESDNQRYYPGTPYFIIPGINPHEITDSLTEDNSLMLMPYAQELREMDLKKSQLVIEPLLVSGDKAYVKTADAQTMNKEAGDKEGIFNLALAVTDSTYTDKEHTTKLVVIGTTQFVVDDLSYYIEDNNINFVMKAINWLCDKEDSIYIAPKSLQTEALVIDSSVATKIIIFSVIVLPLIIFGIGTVIFLRRRHK